ncbi:JM44 [macacine gammaherpesvirus 11]|uniref:JM44 n=2 Tax=macacine gammaherpesvirus 11 TaxID=2560570 RepID=G9JM52_9GAMA|nr:JM44 [Macaca fuscata rhadinovirus]AAT00021.1 JM44 [Macaca fuscata rhadinovirus]AEW87569.1 JM44 [Macaca fuscata rhadinovirus]AEW87739.1 JM44 [Macaca fuscata rhadinovirus]
MYIFPHRNAYVFTHRLHLRTVRHGLGSTRRTNPTVPVLFAINGMWRKLSKHVSNSLSLPSNMGIRGMLCRLHAYTAGTSDRHVLSELL